MLDGLLGDLKQLKKELDGVKETATAEGERHRGEDGKLVNPDIKMTLAELKEQKTSVRDVDGVKFYNQMEHPVEYIPMEIFVQSAVSQVDESTNKLEEVQTSFGSVLHYFGEDEKMPTTDFFGTLFAFLESFDAAKVFVEKQEENRKREEKRLAANKAKEAKKLAAKKEKEAGSVKSSTGKNKDEAPNRKSMGGIAAMAASVAASKQKKQNSSDDQGFRRSEKSQDPKPKGMTGIAAMAAAAALKKKQNTEAEPEPSGMGGIAAMAAAAALKKKQNAEAEPEPSGMGGIAAMAAAAALKKKQSADNESEASGMGGIAAMAAAAALKKKQKNIEKETEPSGVGGIAAMAAAAALKRQEKNAEKETELSGMEGIAAMAAAAALKKQEKNAEKETEPSGMGGIAAMTATATLKEKQEKNAGEETEPSGMGGIAAVAAAAALKKKQNTQNETEPLGIAGIPAMAAAAASKKHEKNAEKETEPSGMGGIAAMAAAAAKKKKNNAENYSEPSGMGGIATMAAAAALKRNEVQQHKIDALDKDVAATSGIESSASMDTMDSDICLSMAAFCNDSITPPQIPKRVPLRPENPISSSVTTGTSNSSSEEGVTILARPIAKRASDGIEINNSLQELKDDIGNENKATVTTNSHTSSSTSGKITASSNTKGGRQTYNSTILRPKLQGDLCDDDQHDDDEISALPSNFSSRHSVALFGNDKKRTEYGENDDNFDTRSIDSDESRNSVDTFQSIQSFARKTNQAYDELNKRLHSHESGQINAHGNDATIAPEGTSNSFQTELPVLSGDNVHSESIQDEHTSEYSAIKSENDSRDDDSTGEENLLMSGQSGIAVAAAQAAILRMRNTNEDNFQHRLSHNNNRESIAAAAAKAARNRRQQQDTREKISVGISGIAAAAAQAALKRNRTAHIDRPALGDTFGGGGIAAAAAKAALKRSQRLQDVN